MIIPYNIYACTMQKALIELSGNEKLGGYYFMTFDTRRSNMKEYPDAITRGFCGEDIHRTTSYHPLCKLGLVFEGCFSNPRA